MSKKFITEFLPNLTGGELASVQSDLEIKSDAETLTAVESESGRDMSVDGAKLDTLDKINAIADKATAYALTGVAVGTVYKTDDTGQVLESRGDSQNGKADFRFVGNPQTSVSDGSNPIPLDYFWDEALGKYADSRPSAGYNSWVEYLGGRWVFGYQPYGYFESDPCASSVHPADATGWAAFDNGYGIGQGTIDGVGIYEPRNWKHDDTILVYDNDEKQLLTNLPDTQQVEVVGEGGRIERYGDNAGLATVFSISSAGSPMVSVVPADASGLYRWRADISKFQQQVVGAATLSYETDKWVLRGVFGGEDFTSALCASTVHPSEVAWSTVSGTGTIDAVTALPETMESNWFAIKNTVYLTVIDAAANGGFDVDGVTVASGTTQGIGWVPVGGYISSNVDPDVSSVHLRIEYINSVNAWANSQSSKRTFVTRTLNELTLPAIFPSGALVTLLTVAT